MDHSRLFATDIFRVALAPAREVASLNADIEATALQLAEDDAAGRGWCREHGYDGYTSYSSLDDLTRRATCFSELAGRLDRLAAEAASRLEFDLRGRPLRLDNLWVNVLAPGGAHSGHLHPNCVLSGTYYVRVPEGSGAIRFEDPRLGLMMAAPPLLASCAPERRRFVRLTPAVGEALLWESWLRHEVEPNRATDARISVSFNYRWG
jgi:uncharacterized protein (TIGR02466 family)